MLSYCSEALMRHIIFIGSPLTFNFFFIDINACFITKQMTFVYLPFFTSEMKILHLPSLLLPVLFHFTFTHFIYRNSARRDREDLSCTTGRWACVDWTDVARTILTVESPRKSQTKIKREITDLIVVFSLANVGMSCFQSPLLFSTLCSTINGFFIYIFCLKQTS